MNVFVGMETSGVVRRAFQALGHNAISCDLLPAEDTPAPAYHGGNWTHWQGDVFDGLVMLSEEREFDLAIFHPDCTYLTNSAAWAYSDGPYHQRVNPGTLVGAARREARQGALETVRRIMALDIKRIAIENPRGAISSAIRPPDQTIQPNQFGDDASKATCLWLKNLPRLKPTGQKPGRLVDDGRRQLGLFGTGKEALAQSDRCRTEPPHAVRQSLARTRSHLSRYRHGYGRAMGMKSTVANKASTTYRYRDKVKRREYMKLLMRRRRAAAKPTKGVVR